MAIGAALGAFGSAMKAATTAHAVASATASGMFSIMGSAQKSKNIVRTARNTTRMFDSMRKTAGYAGIMHELMEAMMSFLFVLKPFIPFIKLLAALVKVYLAPLVKAMVEAFKPGYKGMANFIKWVDDIGGIFATWKWLSEYARYSIGPFGQLFESFRTIGDVIRDTGISIRDLKFPMLDFASNLCVVENSIVSVNSPMISFASNLTVAKSALISVNEPLGDFADLIETISELASSISIGGDGDGKKKKKSDGGGGGGGGGDIPLPPVPIPPIVVFQKGGIPKRNALGLVEPNEAVIPLDKLEWTFQDLKSAASSTNYYLAKNNKLLEKLARRLA